MKKIFLTFILSVFFQFTIYPQPGWLWQNPIPQGNDLNSVCFIDANIGYAVGVKGTILKTTTGGQEWSIQWIGSSIDLNDGSFTDMNNGTVVGQQGAILRTTDGGTSWVSQTVGTTLSLYGIHFVDPQIGYAVGDDGIILRTTNGGVTFVEEEPTPTQPNSILLFQNFPNPFNPSTTIAYQIPEPGFVSLSVYDILGKEIATLVNEEKIVGSYEVEFNG